MRVLSTEPDPDHPTRPKINFAGSIDNHATMVGWLKVTPDNQIRWHFVSGFSSEFALSSTLIHATRNLENRAGHYGGP